MEEVIPSRATDLTGKTFERLRVISRFKSIYYKGRSAYWLCICACGNSKVVRGSFLVDGSVGACSRQCRASFKVGRRFDEEAKARLRRDFKDGMTLNELSCRYECTERHVRNILKETNNENKEAAS